MCPHFSSAALKDLNVPTNIQMSTKVQCMNSSQNTPVQELNGLQKKIKQTSGPSPAQHV